MGMFDNITIEKQLPIPKELKKLDIDWRTYVFQTKDLENCLIDYKISKAGYLYEHVVEREYIPYTTEERKSKNLKPWDLWKEVIEKNTYDKKVNDYHGTVRFYTYDNFDDETDFHIDFDAYFIYGKLDKIKLVEYKKVEARSISNQKWTEEYDKRQKQPWNVFKYYASFVGWRWACRKLSMFFYKLGSFCYNIQQFINRNCT
jgi:hypothetical protein